MTFADAGPLERFRTFLKADPGNLSLIAAAAEAAFDAGDLSATEAFIADYEARAPLTAELCNLAGTAALHRGDVAAAAGLFTRAIAEGGDAPAVRHNLAWARALQREWELALELLDAEVTDVVPAAAALKVQALQHLDRLGEAIAWGEAQAERYPERIAQYGPMFGALASAAMDAGDLERAQRFALRAPRSHESRATLGMLALGEDRYAEAEAAFAEALELNPDSGRGLLGAGLSRLAAGDAEAATRSLDRAAEVFETHLGSWIAAGWSHLIAGRPAEARRRFETALAIDDTFAESHGALAVLDVLDNDLESARRRTEVALRLDRQCFAGLLAKVLLLQHDGQPETAARLRDMALNAPIGASGRTIAQAARALGMRGGR